MSSSLLFAIPPPKFAPTSVWQITIVLPRKTIIPFDLALFSKG